MEQHQILYNLKSIFLGLHRFSVNEYHSAANLVNHNIFGKYFGMSISATSRQIPIFEGSHFFETLQRENGIIPCRVIIPLLGNNISRRRSYDTIIRDCFNFCGSGVLKCTSTKENYYGAPGILLDGDLNPLFIVFYDVEPANISHSQWRITGITIKVAPKVFLESNKLLEKSLVNKIIPMYLPGPINVDTYNSRITGGLFLPKIIVEDISGYIKTPVAPNSHEHINEELNDFLASRVDTDITSLT